MKGKGEMRPLISRKLALEKEALGWLKGKGEMRPRNGGKRRVGSLCHACEINLKVFCCFGKIYCEVFIKILACQFLNKCFQVFLEHFQNIFLEHSKSRFFLSVLI